MRLGCIPPLLAIGLLIGGGQGAYTWWNNREPKVYDIDEYIAKKPSDKWIRITSGMTDFGGATYMGNRITGRVTEVFVPIRSMKGTGKDQVKILMATKRPVMLEAIEKTKTMKPMEAVAYVLERHKDLMAQRDVQGLIRYGIDSKDKEERKIRALNPNLAKDCVIFDEAGKPDPLVSFYLLISGTVLAGFLVMRAAKSGGDRPGTPTPPPMSPPPPMPPIEPPLRQE